MRKAIVRLLFSKPTEIISKTNRVFMEKEFERNFHPFSDVTD
jgi:hypothetical protein